MLVQVFIYKNKKYMYKKLFLNIFLVHILLKYFSCTYTVYFSLIQTYLESLFTIFTDGSEKIDRNFDITCNIILKSYLRKYLRLHYIDKKSVTTLLMYVSTCYIKNYSIV